MQDSGDILEKLNSVIDRHIKYVGDALTLKAHLQGLAIIPLAVAGFARDVDVGQEVHLDRLVAIAFAHFAASALDIERKASGLIAAHLGFGQFDKEIADV